MKKWTWMKHVDESVGQWQPLNCIISLDKRSGGRSPGRPVGTLNTKFHCSLASICWDISLWTECQTEGPIMAIRRPCHKKTSEKLGHKELADLSSVTFQSSLLYCGWALTSESDWIEILTTGQILYDRLRLAMSHRAVFLHCGLLMKAAPELQWFEHQCDFESWVSDTAVRCAIEKARLITFGFKWK